MYETPIYKTDKNKLLLYRNGGPPLACISPHPPLQNRMALLNIVSKPLNRIISSDSSYWKSNRFWVPLLKVWSSDQQHCVHCPESWQKRKFSRLAQLSSASSITWNKVLTLGSHFYPWNFHLEGPSAVREHKSRKKIPWEKEQCSWEIQSEAFSRTPYSK